MDFDNKNLEKTNRHTIPIKILKYSKRKHILVSRANSLRDLTNGSKKRCSIGFGFILDVGFKKLNIDRDEFIEFSRVSFST